MERKQVLLVVLSVLLAVSITTTLTLAQGPSETGQELAPLAAVGTTFTYQGQLKQGSAPVTGPCDFQFGLWDALTLGAQVGVTQTKSSVSVANGLFTTPLDFGANAFNGEARWLASAVRCPATTGSYTPLTPRQPLTPAPLALALPGLYTQQNATSPNVIGGYSGNVISATVVGGVIGGGGSSSYHPNRVWQSYGTVGGGFNNTASGMGAAIGGGSNNTASGIDATVGGGDSNTASGIGATIGGGVMNVASGYVATVPGGDFNRATQPYAFAAGFRASAGYTGTFVWADSTMADFSSTAANQFLIRANGGVGINTANTTANNLTVNGQIIAGGTGVPAGSAEPFVARGGNSGISLDDRSNASLRWVIYPNNGALYFWNGSPRMAIDSAGILTLGGLAGGGGTQLCRNASNQIAACSSSLRYKSNVANLNLGLDTVERLRPVTFDWKETGEHDLGFVAEEVDQVTPLLTTRNADGQVEGVKYDRVGAVLVKAMQEQQQQIAELQTQNTAQQQEIAQLKETGAGTNARLAALEQVVQAKNTGNPSSSSPNLAVLAMGALLGIVVVRRPWRAATVARR